MCGDGEFLAVDEMCMNCGREVVEHLRDHLQIDIAMTLASWEIE